MLSIYWHLGKVSAHAVVVRSCGRSSPVTLAFEPVVEINLLPHDTGPLWHPSFHSLPSPGFPRYPFINQPVWEDEQLGELCPDCPRPGSNSSQPIHGQTCYHCTTERMYGNEVDAMGVKERPLWTFEPWYSILYPSLELPQWDGHKKKFSPCTCSCTSFLHTIVFSLLFPPSLIYILWYSHFTLAFPRGVFRILNYCGLALPKNLYSFTLFRR